MTEAMVDNRALPPLDDEDEDELRRLHDRIIRTGPAPRNDLDDMRSGEVSIQRETATSLDWAQGWKPTLDCWFAFYTKRKYWEAEDQFSVLQELAQTYIPEMEGPSPAQVGLVVDTVRTFPFVELKRSNDNPLIIEYAAGLFPESPEKEILLALKKCKRETLVKKWPIRLRLCVFGARTHSITTDLNINNFYCRGALELNVEAAGQIVTVEVMPIPGRLRVYEA